MPQIAQLAETYASQIFWLLIIFGLVYFVIGRGMVPRVLETVGQRDQQIAGDLAAAQAARDEASAREEAWRKRENESRATAQALTAQAKAAAATETEQRLAAVQVQLDRKIADAEEGIASARAAAAVEIESVAAEATQDIVSRLAGISLAAPEATNAVRRAMAHG